MLLNHLEPRAQADAIRGALEEASGQPLHASDSLADELIATGQAYGADIEVLKMWIYATRVWTPRAYAEWLEAKGFRCYPLFALGA